MYNKISFILFIGVWLIGGIATVLVQIDVIDGSKPVPKWIVIFAFATCVNMVISAAWDYLKDDEMPGNKKIKTKIKNGKH